MNKLTYRQAYDKIIEAYFKNEIQPLLPDFCFCGTLNCNNEDYWCSFDVKRNGIYYSGREFQRMEVALLETMSDVIGIYYKAEYVPEWDISPKYEDALFKGMSAALDVLRQIHIDRDENVDEGIPAFTKRELVKAL